MTNKTYKTFEEIIEQYLTESDVSDIVKNADYHSRIITKILRDNARDELAKQEIAEKDAEIEKLQDKLDEISRYTGGYLYKREMWSAYIYSVVHSIEFRDSERHFELNQRGKDEM